VDRALTLSRPLGDFLLELSVTATNTEQFGGLGKSLTFLRVTRTF